MPNNMNVVNGQFVFDHTTAANGEYTAILSTENKFVDKNIGIKITTPSAQNLTFNATDINTGLSLGTAADGVYSPSVSISGSMSVGTAGWISGSTSLTDQSVKIGTINQSLLKIGETTVSSGDHLTAGTEPITVNITEGYNTARSIIINAESSGTAAAATITATKQAESPTIQITSTNNITGKTNVGNGSASTSSPSTTYYVAVEATAPATTLDITKTINTAGYLGNVTQITASAATSAKTLIYYLPVTSGVATADNSNANVTKYTTDGSNAGTNITGVSGLLSDATTTEPNTSGSYYLAFTGSGHSKVSTAGWFPTGNLTDSSKTVYFTIRKAAATISGSKQAVTPTIATTTTSATGKTNVAATDASPSVPNTNFFVSVQATAPATTLDITKTVGTTGYLATDSQIAASAATTAKTSGVYYIGIDSASFANTATSGENYTDISSTAPILFPGDYLYINKGYTDNVKISLAKLFPDEITSEDYAPAEYIRSGYSAFDASGVEIVGIMPNVTPTLAASVSNTTYFTSQDNSSGASFYITPSYKNSTAGYLTQHSTASNGSAQYYKIKTTTISGTSGNVTLQADDVSNSIYKSSTNTGGAAIVDSAPATNTNYVYIKVQGSGTVSNGSTAGWLTANSSATGTAIKYIRLDKYDGSYTTGTGS